MKLIIEIITPIFLGGSDARQLATVVRVPSIRGQVRYWLRAVLGRRVGNNIDALKTAENNLMGHTGAASLIRFRVTEGKKLLETADRYMMPHRSSRKVMSKSFAEKQLFQLSITPRPGLTTIPDEILAALLLWLNFGGLGKRTRRGYGSLRVVQATAPTGMVSSEKLALFTANKGEQLADHLARVTEWIEATLPVQHAIVKPDYPIFAPSCASVLFCERTYPSQPKKGQPPIYEGAMVPFWTEILRATPWRDDVAYGYADGNGRRASPFHWHIAQTSAGYQWVFTTFWSESTRKHDSIRNWQKVDELLAEIAKQAQGKLVWGRPLEVAHA